MIFSSACAGSFILIFGIAGFIGNFPFINDLMDYSQGTKDDFDTKYVFNSNITSGGDTTYRYL